MNFRISWSSISCTTTGPWNKTKFFKNIYSYTHFNTTANQTLPLDTISVCISYFVHSHHVFSVRSAVSGTLNMAFCQNFFNLFTEYPTLNKFHLLQFLTHHCYQDKSNLAVILVKIGLETIYCFSF